MEDLIGIYHKTITFPKKYGKFKNMPLNERPVGQTDRHAWRGYKKLKLLEKTKGCLVCGGVYSSKYRKCPFCDV